MTKYAVQARATSPNIAFGQKYGVVDNIVSIEAATVDEALNSLTNSLNKNQQGTHIQYEIAYLGDAGPIKIASMINPGDPDKGKQPGVAGPTNSSQVNTKTATEAITDTSKRIIQIEQGTSVTQAIGQIIKQSSYLRDALTMTYTTAETPSNSTASPEITLNKNPPREIQWYNLGARVEPLAWDKKVGDFSYKITYVIQPFKTPGTFTPYGKTSKYYGPHKRYNYWFTGKNTEILEFTQTLDGSYFNIAFTPSSDPNSPTYIPGLDIPSIPGKLNDYERSNSLGRGAEAENQYLTNLYSPKDWSEAKIKILGDPDFLMNDTPGSLNEVYRQYYGNDGFTINPNSGLVFIELNFNEAKDYDNRTGLLNVNEKILFWIDPTNSNFKSNINGIAYLVSQVDSMFSGGSFTQTITCKMSPIPYTQSSTNETSRENDNTPVGDTRTGSSQGSTATTTPSAGGTVSQNNGFRQPQDDATGVDAQVKRIQESTQSQPSTNPPRTIPTNFGIVANDDSTPYDSTTQAGVAATTTQTGIGTTRVTGLINGGRTQTGIGTTRVTGLINGGGTR